MNYNAPIVSPDSVLYNKKRRGNLYFLLIPRTGSRIASAKDKQQSQPTSVRIVIPIVIIMMTQVHKIRQRGRLPVAASSWLNKFARFVRRR